MKKTINEFKADFEAFMTADKKEVKLSANDSGLGNQGLLVKIIQNLQNLWIIKRQKIYEARKKRVWHGIRKKDCCL